MARIDGLVRAIAARVSPAWWVLSVACGGGSGGTGHASSEGSSGATTTAATSDGTTTTEVSSSATAVDTTDSTATETTGGEPTWQVAFEADQSLGAFLSVWGPSADLVYAVGGQQGAGGLSVGAMLRREGGSWTAASLPADTAKLNWIHGVGDTRVIVGERGTILMRDGDDDATAWTSHGCGTVLALWGVWVFAADDAWTVGGDGFMRPPVMCHYDGVAWTEVELPTLSVDSKGLFKLFSPAPGELWAVGDAGLLLHAVDGVWSQVEVDTVADLISLWGTGPDELLIAGGRSNGALARRDADGWATAAFAELPGLNGVWMDEGGLAHVVGIQGTIATVAPGSLAPVTIDPITVLTLHAVWGAPDGRMYAVGGSLEQAPPFVGIVLERDP